MNNSFSWREFTSFGLFLTFLMLLVSGVILYIFPSGRGPGFFWEMGGLTKPAWQNQHIIFGFAFSLLSLCHLFFINWKAFISYLKTKTSQGMKRPAELVTIVVLSSFIGIGTYAGIQPFSGILELGKGISKSWESKALSPSVDRAERITLAELAQQPGQGNDPEESGIQKLDSEYFDNTIQKQIADETAISSPRELAFRDEKMEAQPDTANNTFEQNNSFEQNNTNSWNDVQAAPDDELHRRTRRSCSSCH